ncbi:MAG: peptidase [Candidatus Eremiobacteraeota bacterium]|jgi:leader peptidase (prepilin peptidase)/N-methyltransferase|nr:peptidase [Candidatus Eremiobacteraeota bacterium]
MSAMPALVSTAGAILAGCVDARTGRIPNVISRGTAIAALTLAAQTGDSTAALWGAVLAGGAVFALYALTFGTGIGLGDVKLAAAIGAGYGVYGAALALSAAFVLGGSYGAWLLLMRGARRTDAIRFGPFLAAGTVVAATAAAVLS